MAMMMKALFPNILNSDNVTSGFAHANLKGLTGNHIIAVFNLVVRRNKKTVVVRSRVTLWAKGVSTKIRNSMGNNQGAAYVALPNGMYGVELQRGFFDEDSGSVFWRWNNIPFSISVGRYH